ncbi:hypothetical protein FCL40_17145 [Ferrimonas sediminicola]|uniref:Uncharacterized protein n=1 Tax=Ferrimonas sediminicola TaxID=2569538 RepID=A0A4U1B820_9GAMM|nr:hypothetical protein [Ferrimonas sediminicola]TKB46782.1 hypothetical protein FCL40_17145 [Ferrimonas sediminicola]
MEYVIAIIVLFIAFYFGKLFAYRSRSIGCAIEALQSTFDTYSEDAAPSPRFIKGRLSMAYDDLSRRAETADIKDYAKRMLAVNDPTPEHIAMLLLLKLSNDFKMENSKTQDPIFDVLSSWCENAHGHLVEGEKMKGLS